MLPDSWRRRRRPRDGRAILRQLEAFFWANTQKAPGVSGEAHAPVGRRALNPRPPEPHAGQGSYSKRQLVGFSMASERRRRVPLVRMSGDDGRNGTRNGTRTRTRPSHVRWSNRGQRTTQINLEHGERRSRRLETGRRIGVPSALPQCPPIGYAPRPRAGRALPRSSHGTDLRLPPPTLRRR